MVSRCQYNHSCICTVTSFFSCFCMIWLYKFFFLICSLPFQFFHWKFYWNIHHHYFYGLTFYGVLFPVFPIKKYFVNVFVYYYNQLYCIIYIMKLNLFFHLYSIILIDFILDQKFDELILIVIFILTDHRFTYITR